MYSTQVYLYQQLTRVLLMDTGSGETFIYRYDPVYAKRLTINKGVDNVLLFEFINQQEKPVNITGSSFMFRVINTESNEVLLQKPMTILSAATGRAKVEFDGSELLEVLAQPASYSIQRTQPGGGYSDAVFVDAQAGARAPINIVDSVLPQFVPSAPLTIPTMELSAQFSYDGSGYENYPNSPYWAGGGAGGPGGGWNSYVNPQFVTSFIAPRQSVTTVQMDLVGYTGTIKAQAADNYQSIWYNISDSVTYFNETRTIHWNIEGWYPLVRLAFDSSLFAVPYYQNQVPAFATAFVEDGVITHITMQNNGSGYAAKPLVTILGNGAGARAEAIWSPETGAVTGITVLDGGSGYWRIPNAAITGGQYPISPQNQGAAVVISTGYVENLLYR
jgi:hypothetical protein